MGSNTGYRECSQKLQNEVSEHSGTEGKHTFCEFPRGQSPRQLQSQPPKDTGHQTCCWVWLGPSPKPGALPLGDFEGRGSDLGVRRSSSKLAMHLFSV